MAVVTPGGLVVRRHPKHVFAELSVLVRPGQDVLEPLKSCDAMEQLPSLISYAAGIVVALVVREPLATAIALVCGMVVSKILLPAVDWMPGLLALGKLWVFRCPWVLRHVVALAVILPFAGWRTALGWLVGALVAGASDVGMSMLATLFLFPKNNIDAIHATYMRACRRHARTAKVELSERVIARAIEKGAWQEVWRMYSARMPSAAVNMVASDIEWTDRPRSNGPQ